MCIRRRLVLSMLLVVPFAVGCAHARTGAPAASVGAAAPALSPDTIQARISRAKLAIDSAARAGDVQGGGGWLSGDVNVVTSGGQTLTGREAAVRAMTGVLGGAAVQRVSLNPQRVDYCADGAIERGGDYIIALDRYGGDTLSGRYAARWRVQPDGVLRVEAIQLGAGATSRTALGRCPSLERMRLAARRTTVTLSVPFDSYRMESDFESSMSAAGYGSGRLVGGFGVLDGTAGTEETTAEFTILLGAQHRLANGLLLEGVLSPLAQSGVIQGFNAATTSHLSLEYELRFGALLGGYEWRNARFMAGPVLVLGDFDYRERLFLQTGPNDYQFLGESFQEGMSANRVGVMLQAGYTLPISARVVGNAFAFYRGLLSQSLPATPNFPATDVSLNGGGVGFGLGYTF